MENLFKRFSIESESDLATYEEATTDVNSTHWVKVMKAELESMDSNQVWNLIETPANINLLAISGSIRGKKDLMRLRPSRQGLL